MRNILIASLVITPAIAHAAPWSVDAARSTLTFEGMQSGEPFHGSFKTFTPEVDFSEAEPQKGKIKVSVDITSVTADTKDQTEALPTAEWLNAKAFPKAEFTSTSIIKTGDHAYAASGELNLRGVKKPLTIPFTLLPQAGSMHAKGEFKLNRHDYSIGTGQWEKDTYIAYPVTVKFDLVVSQKP